MDCLDIGEQWQIKSCQRSTNIWVAYSCNKNKAFHTTPVSSIKVYSFRIPPLIYLFRTMTILRYFACKSSAQYTWNHHTLKGCLERNSKYKDKNGDLGFVEMLFFHCHRISTNPDMPWTIKIKA